MKKCQKLKKISFYCFYHPNMNETENSFHFHLLVKKRRRRTRSGPYRGVSVWEPTTPPPSGIHGSDGPKTCRNPCATANKTTLVGCPGKLFRKISQPLLLVARFWLASVWGRLKTESVGSLGCHRGQEPASTGQRWYLCSHTWLFLLSSRWTRPLLVWPILSQEFGSASASSWSRIFNVVLRVNLQLDIKFIWKHFNSLMLQNFITFQLFFCFSLFLISIMWHKKKQLSLKVKARVIGSRSKCR